MRRVLDKTPGTEVIFHGHGNGGFTLQTRGDAGALIDYNARTYDGDRLARRKSEFREVANISDIVFLKWLNEEGMTMRDVANKDAMHKFLKKKLNDGDNAKFRTGPERL